MVCLDATFLVDFFRGRKEAVELVREWKDRNERVTIAAPALAEVATGAGMEETGREQERLDGLSAQLMVLPLTNESAMNAGEIDAELTLAGETIGLIDAMIAAVAMENGEVLVTRNFRHFQRIEGLRVEGY